MSNAHDVCLSAFLDGEAVDPAEVLRALDTDAGREALVEYVRLRAALAHATPMPPEISGRIRPALLKQHHPALFGLPWRTAAALLLCTVLGVWIGRSLVVGADERPPRAVRVIELQQGVDWR